VVAVAADRLLALTLGDPFRGAAPAQRIALAAAALAPAWALSMQLAAVGDQPEAVLTGAAAGAATFVVVAALALPGGGAVAGAEAMVAGFGVSVLATLAALRVMAVGRH
jgi:hypothetical protein